MRSPDPILAYFWPALRKGADPSLTRIFFDTTRRDFFGPEWMKNLWFCGDIFQTKTWPNPTQVIIFWPGPITSFRVVYCLAVKTYGWKSVRIFSTFSYQVWNLKSFPFFPLLTAFTNWLHWVLIHPPHNVLLMRKCDIFDVLCLSSYPTILRA